jgi:pSer/pThr/pTyr-binding forkhead associated (FHA) protein
VSVLLQLPSGKTISLERQTILIGSGTDCDISLPSEVGLQRQHARIRRVADRWLVESQGDWRIRVNHSEPGRTAWLRPGDQIQLAPSGPTLVFQPTADKTNSSTPKTEDQGTDDSGHRLSAMHSARETLKTATLPQLYQQLGNYLADSRKYESQYPRLYRQIADLEAQITDQRAADADKTHAATSSEDRDGLLKRSQALAFKANRVSSRLGRMAFAEFGSQAGPQTLVQQIASAQSLLESLDADIRELRNVANWPITPLNMAVGVIGATVVAICYVVYFAFRNS